MAITASQFANRMNLPLGTNPEGPTQVFRKALDGDLKAASHIADRADYVVTATFDANDGQFNLDIPGADFGLTTTGAVVGFEVTCFQYGATAASCTASKSVGIVVNPAGTLLVPSAVVSSAVLGGAAGVAGVQVSVSGTNVRFIVDTGSAVAQAGFLRIEATKIA